MLCTGKSDAEGFGGLENRTSVFGVLGIEAIRTDDIVVFQNSTATYCPGWESLDYWDRLSRVMVAQASAMSLMD